MDQAVSTVRMQHPAAAVVAKNKLGQGVLIIDESILTWTSEDGSQKISLAYPDISLHAISRDLSNFPNECLFLLVDAKSPELRSYIERADDEDEDEDDKEDGYSPLEVRFVPEDKEALDPMFKAMNECQLLHPDPVDAVSEEEDEEDGDEEEGENGNSVDGTNGSQSQNLQAGDEEPMDE